MQYRMVLLGDPNSRKPTFKANHMHIVWINLTVLDARAKDKEERKKGRVQDGSKCEKRG